MQSESVLRYTSQPNRSNPVAMSFSMSTFAVDAHGVLVELKSDQAGEEPEMGRTLSVMEGEPFPKGLNRRSMLLFVRAHDELPFERARRGRTAARPTLLEDVPEGLAERIQVLRIQGSAQELEQIPPSDWVFVPPAPRAGEEERIGQLMAQYLRWLACGRPKRADKMMPVDKLELSERCRSWYDEAPFDQTELVDALALAIDFVRQCDPAVAQALMEEWRNAQRVLFKKRRRDPTYAQFVLDRIQTELD